MPVRVEVERTAENFKYHGSHVRINYPATIAYLPPVVEMEAVQLVVQVSGYFTVQYFLYKYQPFQTMTLGFKLVRSGRILFGRYRLPHVNAQVPVLA